jgi:hypothetical protein
MNELQKQELQVYEQSLDDQYDVAQSMTTSAKKLERNESEQKDAKLVKEYRYGYEMYVRHWSDGRTTTYNDCSGARYEFKNRNEAHKFARAHSQRYRMMS